MDTEKSTNSSSKGKRLSAKCTAPGCQRSPRTRIGAHELCGLHAQRFRRTGSFDLALRKVTVQAICTVDGCGKPSRTIQGKWCEMHYGRVRRNGNFHAPVWGKWSVTDHGYVMRRDFKHPASSSNGTLYQHRAVLYDLIGDGLHHCHWCKAEVEWRAKGVKKLVVDHLDGDKKNNISSNLVPSCHRCNATRGLFQAWVTKHKDDPFLWHLYIKASRPTAA